MAKPIGTVTFTEDFVYHKTYSHAAWFSDHLVPAGTYSVYARKSYTGCYDYYIDVLTKITDAYFRSSFGGNPFGDDPTGKALIGSEEALKVPVYESQIKKF